jgi:hypothetical protein
MGGWCQLSTCSLIIFVGAAGFRRNASDRDHGGHSYYDLGDWENRQAEYSYRVYFPTVLVMVMGSLRHAC